MPETHNRVVILERDPDLGSLLQLLLTRDGYDVTWVSEPVKVIEEVHRRRPDALIVDLLAPPATDGQPPELPILDPLRNDELTSKIPVLALATSSLPAEAAMTSFNVRERIKMPFDLDELIMKVHNIVHLPPLHAAIPVGDFPSDTLARAEQVLREHSSALLYRWVATLRQEAAWKARGPERFAVVLEDTPVLVEALSAALHFVDVTEYFRTHPNAVERIRCHPRVRKQQGVPLDQVIREFTLLRTALWEMFARYLPPLDWPDMLELQRAVDGGLDQMVEIIVACYLESPEQPDAAAA